MIKSLQNLSALEIAKQLNSLPPDIQSLYLKRIKEYPNISDKDKKTIEKYNINNLFSKKLNLNDLNNTSSANNFFSFIKANNILQQSCAKIKKELTFEQQQKQIIQLINLLDWMYFSFYEIRGKNPRQTYLNYNVIGIDRFNVRAMFDFYFSPIYYYKNNKMFQKYLLIELFSKLGEGGNDKWIENDVWGELYEIFEMLASNLLRKYNLSEDYKKKIEKYINFDGRYNGIKERQFFIDFTENIDELKFELIKMVQDMPLNSKFFNKKPKFKRPQRRRNYERYVGDIMLVFFSLKELIKDFKINGKYLYGNEFMKKIIYEIVKNNVKGTCEFLKEKYNIIDIFGIENNEDIIPVTFNYKKWNEDVEKDNYFGKNKQVRMGGVAQLIFSKK